MFPVKDKQCQGSNCVLCLVDFFEFVDRAHIKLHFHVFLELHVGFEALQNSFEGHLHEF